MSDVSNRESVNVEYYYNKKSKFFQEMKEQPEHSKISVRQFLRFLSKAYHTEVQPLECYLNNNRDWTTVTRSQLFSELLDVNEKSLYSVIKETNSLDMLNINKEYEVFNDCNYFFCIPSGSTLTLSSNSSEMCKSSTTDLDKTFSEINELKNKTSQTKMETNCSQKRNNALKRQNYKIISKEQLSKKTSSKFKPVNKQHLKDPVMNKKATEINRNKNIDTINKSNRKQILLTNIKKDILKKDSSITRLNVRQKEQKPLPKSENGNTLNNGSKLQINPVQKNSSDVSKKIVNNLSPQKLLETKLSNLMETAEIPVVKAVGNSIQCDTKIIEWISQWLISNSPLEKRINLSSPCLTLCCPSLDPTVVVPILASASIFQIHPLIELCLLYCKNNMNEVLKTSSDFSCLDDVLLTKLANLFSNVDVEALRDKNDKIRSCLYTKLILSLCCPEPEPWKGHFSSLANIFKCKHCKKLVLHKIANTVPCLESNLQISSKGKILNLHDQDPDWNLTEYVGNLRLELKCWRRVYWRLWAECHFLYCTSCRSHYSVYTYNKCYHHPERPKFPLQKDKSYVGHYPCCGMKAFKYECVWFPEKGCKTKSHSPLLKNNRASTDIMKLFDLYQPLMFSGKSDSNNTLLDTHSVEPAITCDKNKTKHSRNKVTSRNRDKWKGLRRNFHKKRKGLMNNTVGQAREQIELKKISENFNYKLMKEETDSSETNNSDSRTHDRFSTRFNQDNQRTYEEYILKSVNKMLSYRTSCQNALSDLTNVLTLNDNLSNKGKLTLVKSASNTSSIGSDSSAETESSHDSLSSQSSTLRIYHSRNTSVWNSYNPLPGIYIRIQSEWKDTHNIPLNLLMLPNKFSSQSMNVKLYTSSQTKSCLRTEQNTNWNMAYSFSQKKMELPTFHPGTEDQSRIWVFDARSQELDHLSAASRPVAFKKEYRYHMRHSKLDWDSLIELERYWNAFLGLFFENESTPN